MLLNLHQLYFKLWFSTVLGFLGSGHIYTKRDPNEHTLILLMHGFYDQNLEKYGFPGAGGNNILGET